LFNPNSGTHKVKGFAGHCEGRALAASVRDLGLCRGFGRFFRRFLGKLLNACGLTLG
jgi:hypothetical protein